MERKGRVRPASGNALFLFLPTVSALFQIDFARSGTGFWTHRRESGKSFPFNNLGKRLHFNSLLKGSTAREGSQWTMITVESSLPFLFSLPPAGWAEGM